VNPDSFLREIRMMTALDHPHILKLYGVCTKDNAEMLIITELMANGDLKHYLMNDGGDSILLADLMRFAVQVSSINF